MTESPVKLQDEARVSYLRRQNSDITVEPHQNQSDNQYEHERDYDRNSSDSSIPRSFNDTSPISPSRLFENVSVERPQRPKLGLRDSSLDVGSLTNLGTQQQQQQALPDQTKPEENVMTSRNPPLNIYRILATFFWQITGGFSDAAPGALLPYMEEQYGLTYTLVSLIWMSNALGFIVVACFSHKIQIWFGKKKSLMYGTLSSVVMYGIVLSGTIFPVIVVGFFFGGIGLATVLAQINVFLSRLDKLSKYLSLCHASYGAGATISPLLATTMVTAGIPWHYFYLILLGMMAINTVLFYFAFKGADQDLAPWDHDESDERAKRQQQQQQQQQQLQQLQQHHQIDEQGIGLIDLDQNGAFDKQRRKSHAKDATNDTVVLAAIKNSTTWLLAFFILFYQGSEVSLAGWIVTFLLDYRKGPSSVGYVASGFWAGLTIGRLVLTRPMHKYFGIRRSVFVLSIVSIVLVGLTWAIPNVFAAGIIVSIAGIFIGPNYPLMITLSADLLPRKIQVVSLTIVTAFGSSGGALFPFIVGLLSQSLGPFVVLPAFIILYSGMLFLWISLPNTERRKRGQTNLSLLQRLW